MSKVSARKGLKSAQGLKARASWGRLIVLPKPRKSWLLAGTALTAGVLGAVMLTPAPAMASCDANADDTVFNCSSTFTTNGETFSADGDFNVNVQGIPSASNDIAHITGDDDDPVLTINAGAHNGVITVEEEATVTGYDPGGKGSDRDGIEVNGGVALDFYIDGTIIAEDGFNGLFDEEGVALQLNGTNGTTSYNINIGETGQLGANDDDLIVDVNGNVLATVINNDGTMNGRMEFDDDAAGVTINNYSVTTWNTSGINDYTDAADVINNEGGALNTTGGISAFLFRKGDDILRNTKGGTIDTEADSTTFLFDRDADRLENTKGAIFTTNNLTTFFFDRPDFFVILPLGFTEAGAQSADVFENSKGATFNANDTTSFFFGGGDDEFWNEKGATFNANDITTFAFGSGHDEFWNTKGADFNATGLTTFFFDNPELFLGLPVPFTEDGDQGNDVFENSKGATFNAGVYGGDIDATSFYFGGYGDEFRNEKGATFNANDLTVFSFGTGDDTFLNRWGGTFNVNGITEFFFGDDYDVTRNYATINVNGLLNFWDLEKFYNSGDGYGGIIDMRNGNILPDVTSIFGPGLGGGDFIGGYDSRLGVDVFFGPPLPSFPFGYSDLLVIGGGIYGETAILIDKLNTEPGGFNPVGIDVVLYSSGATIENPCGPGPCQYGDAFYISPDSPDYIHVGSSGAIEDGLFAWFLFQDDAGPGGDFELRGLGGPGAVNAPGIVTGAQNIFYDTLSVVEDHTYGHQFGGAGGGGADLPMEDAAVATGGDGGTRTGLWAKVGGSWTERDTSVTESMVTYDTGSTQEIYSVLGGADMKPWGADSAVRLGLFGGYVTSSLDFDLGTTSADYEGGVVGGYAAYNDGAFYADVTVKGDILKTDYSFAGFEVDADVTNIGVAGNTGYRMQMGAGFVEPIASIAYVHSDVDDFTGGGGTVSFSENDSLRAGAGARIGATFATGGGTTELAVLGRVWNEFEDANEVTVTDGVGATTTFSDDIEGIFGEVQATATMSNASKTLSAFVSGGGTFGEDFTSWNARAGVRAGF